MANISVQDSDNEETTNELEAATQEEAVTQQPEEYSKPPRRGPSKLIVLLVILILGALAAGLLFVLNDRNHLKKEVSKLSQSQVSAVDEAKQLSTAVGKLIELPVDETPTIATVVDAAKVKTQPFFTNAQNGDKVLLYSKSSKAILYRQSTNKIIEVAPINIGNNQTPVDTTTTKEK